jgi:hypothetical protein
MTYPETPVIGDAQRATIGNLIAECRQRLEGLPMTEEHCYANPHLYLPWLYHIHGRMEQNNSIQEPVPLTKATKGFVHRQLETLINFKKLPGRFRKTIEHHVKAAINSENPTEPFVNRRFEGTLQRSSAPLDRRQTKVHDLLHEEKAAIDDFIARTRTQIADREFRPLKYTDPRGARLFNLLPIHSLDMRFITINLQALSKMIKDTRVVRAPGKTETMNDLCWRLFDMQRIGFQERSQLEESDEKKGFTGVIRCDGVALEFICDRPTSSRTEPPIPTDIAKETELDNAIVWGVDPGVRDVFVASDGDELARHRIRKTSTSEYYQMAGFNSAKIKRSKYDRSHRDARNVVAQTPSTKTTDRDQFNAALQYIFRNFDALRDYYTDVQRKLKFQNYRQRQKAMNEMCKRLFSGNSKYQPECADIQQQNLQKWKPLSPRDGQDERTRPVVVAFGAAKFGNLRGNVSAPTKLFKAALLNHVKKLKRNIQRNDLHGPKYVVMIDEYFTSQICPLCKTRTTSNEVDADDQKIHSVHNCDSCHTRRNRDHMASMNIRNIFLYMANNNDKRPEIFQQG